LGNLTTDDLVSIRSLPAAIAIHGNDVIPLGQMIEGAEADRGGTVDQLKALLGGGGGSGGIGLEYQFAPEIDPAPPHRFLRFNNADHKLATQIIASRFDRDDSDRATYLEQIEDAAIVQVSNQANGTYAAYEGQGGDNAAPESIVLFISYLWGNLTISAGDDLLLQWQPKPTVSTPFSVFVESFFQPAVNAEVMLGAYGEVSGFEVGTHVYMSGNYYVVSEKSPAFKVRNTGYKYNQPPGDLVQGYGPLFPSAPLLPLGETWIEYTKEKQALPKKGRAIANRTANIEFGLPDGAIGDNCQIQGKGIGIWSVVNGTIKLPDGTSDTGIRRLATHQYAGVDLLCIDSSTWVARDATNLELFTAPENLYTLFNHFWNLDEPVDPRTDSISDKILASSFFGAVGTVPGLIGNAAQFTGDGTSALQQKGLSRVGVNPSLIADVDKPIFVTCAVNLSALSGRMGIVGKLNRDELDISSNPEREWLLYYEGGFKFAAYDTSDNTFHAAQATTFGAATIGSWAIVMAWFDPAGNTLNISVNDGAVDFVSVPSGFSIRPSNSQFRIGNGQINGMWGLAGAVDCVGFGKKIPTAGQRSLIYGDGAGYSPS
jgi:hypothetical protein